MSFKKMLGLGGSEEKSQASKRHTSSAVSGEHTGAQSTAAQKASNLVPATVAERDEAEKDFTVCARESEVHSPASVGVAGSHLQQAKPLLGYSSTRQDLRQMYYAAEVEGHMGRGQASYCRGRATRGRSSSQVLPG